MSSLAEHVDSPVIKDWCHSKLEVKTFHYNWTIHNFSFRSESCLNFVESSQFPADSANGEPKWSLRAYPKGYEPCTDQYFGLTIVSHSESEVSAYFKISISTDRGLSSKELNIATRTFTEDGRILYIPKFIALSSIKDYLFPQNTLTILCELTVVNDVGFISGQSSTLQFKVPENKLIEDLGTLLGNDKFSDIILVSSGHELKAHKAILAARSEVFAAMFEHDMEEQNQNRVCIADISHKVLKEMLHYMYTGEAPNIHTMAESLFAAADKYGLQSLKIMCEKSLRHYMVIENSANTLMLADRHNAKELKSQTISFIISHATSVMETQGWKDMTTLQFHLVEEIFCAIAQYLKIY